MEENGQEVSSNLSRLGNNGIRSLNTCSHISQL